MTDGESRNDARGVVISAFYKFVPMPDVSEFRDQVLDICDRAGMFGSILVAPEGINGTVAGSSDATDELFQCAPTTARFRSAG